MKSPLKITLAALVAILAFVPFAQAADDNDAPPPPPPGEGPGGPGGPEGRRGGPRGDRIKMLDEKLKLTDAQKEKLKPIFAEERKEIEALRDNKDLSREDRRAKMMEIMKRYSARIRAELTPEQQATYDKMLEEMAKRGPGGPGGRREKDKN